MMALVGFKPLPGCSRASFDPSLEIFVDHGRFYRYVHDIGLVNLYGNRLVTQQFVSSLQCQNVDRMCFVAVNISP